MKPLSPTKRTKKGMDGKHSGPSDLESVKTEDFENQFHSLMVKRVSPTTNGSYGQMHVDSDLDTVQSQMIHEKFQSALSKNRYLASFQVM